MNTGPELKVEQAEREVSDDGSAGFLEWLVVLAKHRRLMWTLPLAGAVLGVALAFLLPLEYTAVARIMPPQQPQSTAAAMLSQLGGAAGFVAPSLGLRSPSDLYVAMLKTNTVADALIDRFKLKELYGTKYQDDTRKRLWRNSAISAEKSGVITIQFSARDARLSAEVAAAYVEELHRLTGTLAVTEASQRRLFFERQLEQAKEKLAESEVRLRGAIDSGGLVSVDAQSRATIETVARLRAQITAKQVQIGVVQSYATADNPDLKRAAQELASLRQELAKLEGTSSEGVLHGPAGTVEGLGNVRLLRDVKYNEVIFELMAKQYEIARVDESRDAPVIQVLDKPLPPDRKSFPPRLVIAVACTFLSMIIAVAIAFGREWLVRTRRDPVRSAKLAVLASAWRRRQ